MNSALRQIGRTGIEVTPVSIGCWAIVGDDTWGAQDKAEAIAALRAAADCGINFFDTAEGYGHGYSEELVAEALGDRRDQIVIASKVGPGHAADPKSLRKSCEDSLRHLHTDYLDLYYLHWPIRNAPIEEALAGFDKLREEGKIRAFGVSNYGKLDLPELLAHGRCEANQLPYSLLWRVIENEIVPICLENDLSIMCYSPLMQGLLTGKFRTPDDVPAGRARTRLFAGTRPDSRHGEPGHEAEAFRTIDAIADIAAEVGRPMGEVALAWLLHRPGVASVIVGARNPAQAEQNRRAMDLVLEPEILARLDAATASLKRNLGTNPDMWQAESRYR